MQSDCWFLPSPAPVYLVRADGKIDVAADGKAVAATVEPPAGAAYVGWHECVVQRRDGRARRPRALREVSLREVSLAPPSEEQHAPPSPGGGAAALQAVV